MEVRIEVSKTPSRGIARQQMWLVWSSDPGINPITARITGLSSSHYSLHIQHRRILT